MPASSPQIQLLHPRLPLLARATGLTLVVVFALLVLAAALPFNPRSIAWAAQSWPAAPSMPPPWGLWGSPCCASAPCSNPSPTCRTAGGRLCAGRAAATRPWGWPAWA